MGRKRMEDARDSSPTDYKEKYVKEWTVYKKRIENEKSLHAGQIQQLSQPANWEIKFFETQPDSSRKNHF